MTFRTTYQANKQLTNQINYHSNIVLLGSCFTENISNKLHYYRFNVMNNPFGILFNPIAIEKLIHHSITNFQYTANNLVFQNEQWHCLDAHSDMSNNNIDKVLNDLNTALKNTKTTLNKASHIIITLGTAWVYEYLKTEEIVANCHKIPQKEFHKQLLSVHKIELSLENIIQNMHKVNPNCQIIFTVSPVRHLKDGFVENMLSKSHLLTAIHNVLSKKTHYFPAYEIMMDDLRDYRFYNADMLHPNQTAIDYIWDKFVNRWIDSSEKETMNQVAQIQKGLAHKPFNENSKKHQQFLAKIYQKIKKLEKLKGIRFNSY